MHAARLMPAETFKRDWRRAQVAGLTALAPWPAHALIGGLAGVCTALLALPSRFLTGCVLVDFCAVIAHRVAPCANYTAFSTGRWLAIALVLALAGGGYGLLRHLAVKHEWALLIGRLRIGVDFLYAIAIGYVLGWTLLQRLTPAIPTLSAGFLAAVSGPIAGALWPRLQNLLVARTLLGQSDADPAGLHRLLCRHFGLRWDQVRVEFGAQGVQLAGPFDPADEGRIADLFRHAFKTALPFAVATTLSPHQLERYRQPLGPSGRPGRLPRDRTAYLAIVLAVAFGGSIYSAYRLGLYAPLSGDDLHAFATVHSGSQARTCPATP